MISSLLNRLGLGGAAVDNGTQAASFMTASIENIGRHIDAFASIEAWRGMVPKGFQVDFLGVLTDANFRTMWGVNPAATGGHELATKLPSLADGEGWFEAMNWLLAAREARDNFTMITLGACYGAQAVGSYKMLQLLNPMPCKLVTVEPEPENHQWVIKHLKDNGINPEEHWLLNTAISDTNRAVLFPVGSPGSGAQNCFSTNEDQARQNYVDLIIKERRERDALRSLILHNSTGLSKNLTPGTKYVFDAEIKYVSALTLRDLLGPFKRVDFLEADIQQSEIVVFPPFIDLLTRKVRRIHMGTHGGDVHAALCKQFADAGWEILFSFAPNSHFDTPHGSFDTNDGVLSVVNPRL